MTTGPTQSVSVRLRALTLRDAGISWKWRNEEQVRNHFSGHSSEVSVEQELAWMKKTISSNYPLTAFGIERTDTRTLAGMTFLKQISFVHRQAEFAILLGKEHSGKGFGSVACRLTLEFGFAALSLHRIWLKVRDDNPAAIRIYEKCGFRKEGTLRDDVFKKGSFHDQLTMAVLENEFRP